MSDVVIVGAKRTAIGNFNGGLSTVSAHDLAAIVIKDLLADTGLQGSDVSEVILGNVLSAGQGQNPARQASMAGDLPDTVPAMGINMVCGSGLRAVYVGAQAIKNGDSSIVMAGGMENMSMSRHAMHARTGVKFGDVSVEDTMLKDGLTDAFHKYHMGMTAENIAKKYGISRLEQDEYSVASQQKTGVAMSENWFKDEIVRVSVPGRKEAVIVSTDEFPRANTNLDSLSKLKPAFLKDGSGTVTAGNASGINDGAAVLLLMSSQEAMKRNIAPLCRYVAAATAGVDPSVMGTGPIPAVRSAVAKAGWSLDDVDLFELNEAFAAQAIAVQRELNIPEDKINIHGGSIALGHPIGASGARILVTLIHALKRTSGKKGCAALCIGGGMGIALCVEIM